MAIINLHRGDFRTIKPVAQKLYQFWGGKKDQNFYATMMGICAEYATITYLNEYLGAYPPIKFRTDYNNGCDGGYDFKMPDDLKWDVKCAGKNEKYDPVKVLKTKAQIICFTRRISSREYRINGFAPRSRLNASNIEQAGLIPIEMLPKMFPARFINAKSSAYERKYRTDLTRAGDLVQNTILDLEVKLTMKGAA